MDWFDRLQLQPVVAVCRECKTMADGGRRLCDQSRTQRSASNDTDHLRKCLLMHGLGLERVTALEVLPEKASAVRLPSHR